MKSHSLLEVYSGKEREGYIKSITKWVCMSGLKQARVGHETWQPGGSILGEIIEEHGGPSMLFAASAKALAQALGKVLAKALTKVPPQKSTLNISSFQSPT